ncbi:MAG: site-2 protease family protein [Acidimicrobiales bacterium]
MSTTAGLIGLALAVSALVVLHELGHWWVAGRCGIKVVGFSIGFGPTLLSWRAGHVRCAVKLIPLGGFVQLLDERASAVSAEELPRAFTRVHPAKRLATLVAGPASNFLLGILLLALSLWHDGAVRLRPILGPVAAGSIAAHAGLRGGDVIEIVVAASAIELGRRSPLAGSHPADPSGGRGWPSTGCRITQALRAAKRVDAHVQLLQKLFACLVYLHRPRSRVQIAPVTALALRALRTQKTRPCEGLVDHSVR